MKDKKIIKIFILFCLVFSTSFTYSKISKSNEQIIEKRLNEISNNVRCLVCRNQSIDDSNSDFANDIKKIIIIHLNNNKSDEFIYKYANDFSKLQTKCKNTNKKPKNKDQWLVYCSNYNCIR